MESLQGVTSIAIRQRIELGELALSFETRNKYEVTGHDGRPLAFVAEQGKGFLGMLLRQVAGHWRTFDLHFFTPDRQLALIARHPFRFLFQRLEVALPSGALLGAVQQRFGVLYKKFDIEDLDGRVLLTMRAPMWSFWTFPLVKHGQQVAVIRKRWSGLLKEALSDADNFAVVFESPALSATERVLTLAAAIFVDLVYFERKASH
jgi:hypothetical protein